MKSNLVRAPIVLAAVISGAFVLLALVALVTSNPRWDDHLINAVATAAFRPAPGTSKRARVISIVSLIALAVFVVMAIAVAVFIDNMSFL